VLLCNNENVQGSVLSRRGNHHNHPR